MRFADQGTSVSSIEADVEKIYRVQVQHSTGREPKDITKLKENYLMAKKKSSRKNREVLVVASKVKGYIKTKKMNTSADSIAALSNKIYCMIDEAATRSKANGRKTVKAQDV